jgi:hypothetical protein
MKAEGLRLGRKLGRHLQQQQQQRQQQGDDTLVSATGGVLAFS